MSKPRVAVVMGSESDWATMQRCDEQLRRLGIETRVEIMSAHRAPDRVRAFAEAVADEGFEVVIAAAGMSAALAGTIAAHTTVPVIGVPMCGGSLQGIDALLSTVQMPPGVPVATVGIGESGAVNAAILAAQILAGRHRDLADALREHKAYLARNVTVKNQALQEHLRQRGSSEMAADDVPKARPAATPLAQQERSPTKPTEQPPARSARMRGAMSVSVGHAVPEMGATDSSETADLERLAELAANMSEEDARALQELVNKLGKKTGE